MRVELEEERENVEQKHGDRSEEWRQTLIESNQKLTHGIFLKSSKTSSVMKRDLASSLIYTSSIDLHHLRKPLGSYVYSSTNALASLSLSAL